MKDFGISESDFGSLFFVGVNGITLSGEERAHLKKLRPIGFLPFAKNFNQAAPYREWLSDFKSLVRDFSEAAGHKKILVSLDHEGGRVIRTPDPTTCFPYPYYWKDKIIEITKSIAVELSSFGINLSFSPCADIHSNPKNPVIGPRAFGTTPESVASGAKEVVRTLLQSGIIPCAKHFPGHGDTSGDSHFGLPRLTLPRDVVSKRELVPFIELIAAKAPMIMTAHVVFEAFDGKNPATLSAEVLTNLLRNELKYEGVVVSDSLYMQAVKQRFAADTGIVDSFNAGCDMFIVSDAKEGDNIKFALKLAGDLVEGVRSGAISPERLQTAKKRVGKLVEMASIPQFKELDPSIFESHGKLAKGLGVSTDQFKRDFNVEFYPPHRKIKLA